MKFRSVGWGELNLRQLFFIEKTFRTVQKTAKKRCVLRMEQSLSLPTHKHNRHCHNNYFPMTTTHPHPALTLLFPLFLFSLLPLTAQAPFVPCGTDILHQEALSNPDFQHQVWYAEFELIDGQSMFVKGDITPYLP
ncbi:MAG: hypothetical protein Q8K92_12355 [Leadbetterella sp.]|nr:hypothetical protein [Leadbetterella sp.]